MIFHYQYYRQILHWLAILAKLVNFPYLTQEEEVNLAMKLHEENDVNAAHALVTSHLRLVVKIASSYKNYGPTCYGINS